MTSRRPRHLVLISCCVALTPFAFAQTSTSTTTNTTRTAPTTTTTSPTQTAPGTVVVPSAPFSPAPVTQPVPSPVVPPVAAPITAPGAVTQPSGPTAAEQAAQVPGTAPLPGSTNASTALDASGRLGVSGMSVDALATAGVETAVDPRTALFNLRRANAADQPVVTTEIQVRLDATSRALTELRALARHQGFPISSADYDQLAAEVSVREDVLRETLRNATSTNSEQEWQQLQNVLDMQYSAYADAVLRARRLLIPLGG